MYVSELIFEKALTIKNVFLNFTTTDKTASAGFKGKY